MHKSFVATLNDLLTSGEVIDRKDIEEGNVGQALISFALYLDKESTSKPDDTPWLTISAMIIQFEEKAQIFATPSELYTAIKTMRGLTDRQILIYDQPRGYLLKPGLELRRRVSIGTLLKIAGANVNGLTANAVIIDELVEEEQND